MGIRESAVNELGNYLRSRDPEMVELAVASLEKMKEDDSRRISSLAEKLLGEFKEARAPKEKTDYLGITPEIKSEAGNISNEELLVPAKANLGDKPVQATVQPIPEGAGKSVDSSSVPQGSILDSSFWFKWIGMVVLATVLSLILYNYDYSGGISGSPLLIGLSGVVTGLSGLAQWLVFRNRLNATWIGVNLVAGIVLGVLHNLLFNTTDWGKEHLGILLTAWLISNCILGQRLIRKTQGTSRSFRLRVRRNWPGQVYTPTSFSFHFPWFCYYLA